MDKNITAIGEILWDVYPEQKRLGGAPFNFIYHAHKITGRANFISSIGNDENGKEILSFLKSKNFPTDYITIDKDHPTGTVKVKLTDDKTPQFKISEECSYDFITLNKKAKELVKKNTAILYFGTLSQRNKITRSSIQSLYGLDIKYFCDLNLRHDFFSKEMIEKALEVASILKVNEYELEKLKKIFDLANENKKAIDQLKKNFNIDLICVTSGEKGAVIFDGNKFDEHKVTTQNIVDTVGAGDAFASILCIGYLNKMDIKLLNMLANDFASNICMVEGALPNNDDFYNKYTNDG